MEDKRQAARWQIEDKKKAVISYLGEREEVDLLDVSSGGMKVRLSHPVASGALVTGEFKILSHMGPFFVRGVVNRVEEKGGAWESAIQFQKVSTFPLEEYAQ